MSLKAIGSVTLLNVDDGSQGEQGLSVSKVSTQYYLSTSPTSLTGGSWVDTQPKVTTGKYLWERNKTTLSDNSVVYSDAYYAQTISGLVSDVDNVKGQITNKVWQSDITTSINSYDNSTVSTIRDRVSTTEQNLTGITTRVGAVESTTGSLGTRMTAAESSISQNADNIELKVSKDGVISSINQSPESITISADKVNIAGSTAFTSLNSQVTAIQNETNQKSELIRGTQTAATYSWTGTSSTISQLTDGMEIRYWLPFSVAGGTVSGSYSYYDGSKTTTGTNTGVGLTLTLKDGTMTEEIPVYYGSMSRLTSHYGYGNIIRMVYRENVRVNNGNSTYYTVEKGFWCDANYDTNSNYVQYSTAVTSGATNGVYQYSLIMRDSANTWVSIATTNGTGTSKSAYTGGLYYDKVLYHDSGTNYASNKTTGAVYDSIAFDLRYSTNCGTTLTNRKPVYLVGTINNTDKRFYLDTTQWWTQTVPTSADGKTYIYIGEAYSSYQVWLATENKAYQYYNGRFITLEEIKDLEAMTWINSTGQKAADIIANWATDATSATTTINGGLIQTHTIQASHLATNAIMSNNYQASQNANSPYSVTGSFLDLDNGNFYTPNFGLDNVNGNAYFNGEITATSGQIGDDTSNHWQIGTVVDFNGNQSAAIESNGTSYIQSGDWMISNNRIDTRHYDNQRKYTYLYEDGVYWDFGLHTPSLTSSNDYENNFIYIRNHESTIPTLEGAWNYVFRVDRNGMIYINGLSLDEKYASIDGVSSAYLPTTGGSVTGNLSVGGNLSVTGTITGLKNLSINGKTYNGSSAVTVGTIGAAYGGTGQTSLINSANALINALSTGSDTPKDNDYYVSQYVNGGTSTTTYHRRPMSKLWEYIKSKISAEDGLLDDDYVPKTGGEFTGAVTISDALIADEATVGNLIVNGVGRFTNGIYGDLTGNASTATVAAKVADSGNGQATTFGYSKTGLTTTSDIAAWDGYELRKITPANLKTSLSLAKGDVGLGNVENKSSATIRGELTSSNVTTALGYTPYNGATNPNGYVSSSGVTSITLKAGTGISLDVDNTAITSTGTRTITNTGVRSISEGTTNGTISVNTGGTTADVVVHGLQALAYKASLGASDVGLGNVTNNKQVKGLSSGTTSGHLVTWGSDGYTVADSGIASGSVTTKITLSGSDYSASSNTITITKANLQSAVQDTSLVLMTAAERSKLSSIQVSEGGTIDFSGVTASAPITATVNETTKAVNITHNTSGVTQGTYRSVTVNAYGHVTAGTNPTTLSGYGITDAKIASGVITLGSNTITPLTASSTLDATKLSGTASIDTTGNATTATKFSSNRPIALTGDVTGSVSSNGESGWSIATTVADNSHNHYLDTILQGNSAVAGSLDPLTQSMVGSASSNKSFGLPADAIVIEYSTDGGSTWLDYGATDAQKKSLFNETRNFNFFLGKASTKEANNVNNRLRITIEPIDRYTFFNGIYCWYSSQGNTTVMDLERSTKGSPNTFTTVFTGQSVQGWSGNNIRYFSAGQFGGSSTQTSNYYKYRITFRMIAVNTDNASSLVNDIRFFGVNVWNANSNAGVNNMLTKNRLYTWDNDLNVIFPAKITATSFEGVAWDSITNKPINLKSYSGSLATGGWAILNDKSNSPSIAIAYNNNNASWNSGKYSSSMVFGCNDTRGLLDLSYNQPIVTFGGSSYSGATDDNPKWYFKLKGVSEQIYTFPSTSKTLAATDGSNASGTWDISISGNANTATTASTATKATQDGSGNTITSYYVTLSTAQTISGAKTFSSAVTFANGTWNLMGDDAYIGDCNAAGRIGIKGKNGATGVRFVPYSGSTNNDITIDGTGNLTATGNLIQQGTVTVGSHAKLAYNESLECLEFSFV